MIGETRVIHGSVTDWVDALRVRSRLRQLPQHCPVAKASPEVSKEVRQAAGKGREEADQAAKETAEEVEQAAPARHHHVVKQLQSSSFASIKTVSSCKFPGAISQIVS